MRQFNHCNYTFGRIRLTILIGTGSILFSCLDYAPAVGLRTPNQDPEAIARGNAFIATAHNPSAIYYNPAGITQLQGSHAGFGFNFVSAQSSFEGSMPGTDAETDFEVQPIPQFYCTYNPSNIPVTFGLGVYVPFGLGLEWPEDVVFQTQAVEGRLDYTTVAPVVAWQPFESLSVAAGPNIAYSRVMLRRSIGIAPGDEFRFRGDDFAFGYKLGLLWQPHAKWSFGASYHSQTKVNYRGNSSVKPIVPGQTGTTMETDFPQFIMAGISFRPTTNWNFEVGIDWTDWDVVNTVVLEDTSFGNVPFPLNWESSIMVYSGVSRYLNNGYWIGAGYFYSQNSVPEDDFTPFVPDTELHIASLGLGQKGKSWSWAISSQFMTGPSREIANGTTANGEFSWMIFTVGLSAGYRF